MGIIGTGGVTIINNGSANTNPDGDNTPVYFANCATPLALPTSTYNNGTAGVGATLTANSNGALTTTYTDGVALSVGLIVLVWKQTSALQNGLYEITQIGTAGTPWILTRLAIYDTTSEVYPSQVNILGGTTYANLYFLQQTATPTIGTSSIVFQTVSAPTTTTINQNLRLVDTYTTSALPTCTYTPNASATTPALNAYLNATANGAFPTLNGVAPFQYMKVLVTGQADQKQNGDYILQNVGSASSTWRLSRISYTASGLYPIWWGIYQGTGRGLIFEQTTSTLTTATIGVSGNIVFVQVSSAGLTYFTEAQNSSAPNATVKVDSLTAVASTTDADFSIVPKGAGAFQLAIPDNLTNGGNKRGANAIDLQTFRGNASQVASGSYSVTIGTSNTASSSLSYCLGSTNISSNTFAVSIGYQNTASGNSAVTIGNSNTANTIYGVAIGYSNSVGGIGAGLGWQNSVGGNYVVAIGLSNTTTANGAIVMGSYSTSSNTNAVSIGNANLSSGTSSVTLGSSNTSNSDYSASFGNYGGSNSIINKISFGNRSWTDGSIYQNASGVLQSGKVMYSGRTTDATVTTLTTNQAVASATNQLTLINNQAIRFKGNVVGKQNSNSVNVAVWDIDGVIVRGNGANTTVLLISNINLISNASGWGTPTLTADTTTGCLKLTVTGLGATTIGWFANLETTEIAIA